MGLHSDPPSALTLGDRVDSSELSRACVQARAFGCASDSYDYMVARVSAFAAPLPSSIFASMNSFRVITLDR